MKLKGISLWQPWAALLVSGEKKFETRSKPTSHRGWLAIHAAKGGLTKRGLNELRKNGYLAWALDNMPNARGVIIGVVNVTDSRRVECCDLCDGCGWYEGGPTIQTTCLRCAGLGTRPEGLRLTEQEAAFGNYDLREEQRYAWATDRCYRLSAPIPFKATQGFFYVPDAITQSIRGQLPGGTI